MILECLYITLCSGVEFFDSPIAHTSRIQMFIIPYYTLIATEPSELGTLQILILLHDS